MPWKNWQVLTKYSFFKVEESYSITNIFCLFVWGLPKTNHQIEPPCVLLQDETNVNPFHWHIKMFHCHLLILVSRQKAIEKFVDNRLLMYTYRLFFFWRLLLNQNSFKISSGSDVKAIKIIIYKCVLLSSLFFVYNFICLQKCRFATLCSFV